MAGEQRRQQNNFSFVGLTILPRYLAQFRAGRGKVQLRPNAAGPRAEELFDGRAQLEALGI